MSECNAPTTWSGVCNRGTHSCTVKHVAPQQVEEARKFTVHRINHGPQDDDAYWTVESKKFIDQEVICGDPNDAQLVADALNAAQRTADLREQLAEAQQENRELRGQPHVGLWLRCNDAETKLQAAERDLAQLRAQVEGLAEMAVEIHMMHPPMHGQGIVDPCAHPTCKKFAALSHPPSGTPMNDE